MNSALITLVGLIAVPAVVLMVLRINATLVFLSICLGDVLVQFVGKDASSILTAMGVHLGGQTIKLFLLALPTVLTAVFMIKTVRGSKLVINALPAVGAGLLLALLIVPLLPMNMNVNILSSSLWHQVQAAQDMIVGLSALLCLFVLWLQRPKAGDDKHGKKHH